MSKAILILNGADLSPQEISYISDMQVSGAYLTCADGGYAKIKGKLKPDLVIGDFDSFPIKDVEQGIETIVYEVEKDFTDGHICVQTLSQKGFDEIEIFGATGGERCDHFLSNLSLLPLAAINGSRAVIRDRYFDIYYYEKDFSLFTKKKNTVSIVPFTDEAHIKYATGLKYPMNDITLNKIHILGISNMAVQSEISVGVDGGGVLVFVQK